MRSSVASALLLVGLFGCTNPYDREGSEPFECRDGSDNDDDGYFDCADNGCWASPDCDGEDTDHDTGEDTDTGDTDTGDTDTGSDSDTDDDSDTATTDTDGGCTTWVCDLESVQIAYTQDHHVMDDFSCAAGVLCDCELVFEGEGVFVGADVWRVTYFGTFEIVQMNGDPIHCESLAGGSWHDTETGAAYHTFRFRDNGSQLDLWVAHGSATGFEPIQTTGPAAIAAQQFPIWDMRATWNPLTLEATHEETGGGFAGLVQISTIHHVEFSFANAP